MKKIEPHLTEEQLQLLAEGKGDIADPFIQAHLQQCHRCRQQLFLYKQLFQEIQKLPAPDIPGSWVTKVQQNIKKRTFESIPLWQIAFFAVSVAVGFFYILIHTPIIPSFMDTFHPLWQVFQSHFSRWLQEGEKWWPVALGAIVSLFFIEFMDRFLIQRRRKV